MTNNTLKNEIKEFIEKHYLIENTTYNINYNFIINKTGFNPIDKHIENFCVLYSHVNKNGKIDKIYG